MSTAFSLSFVSCFLMLYAQGIEIRSSCLPGNNHKAKPGPEGPEYKACHIFKENSCCTANFTKQLDVPVIQKIYTFSWTLCGNLSKKCQDFMVGVECFYRCSPNVAHWQDKNDTQAFNNAPVCSQYCDDWFEACKDDQTCAKNWVTGMNYTKQGDNYCKNSTCRTFKDLFVNGEGLCNNMWDDSFKYTRPSEGLCLHFNFSGPTNPNNDVVDKLFGVSPTSQASPTNATSDAVDKPSGGSTTSQASFVLAFVTLALTRLILVA